MLFVGESPGGDFTFWGKIVSVFVFIVHLFLVSICISAIMGEDNMLTKVVKDVDRMRKEAKEKDRERDNKLHEINVKVDSMRSSIRSSDQKMTSNWKTIINVVKKRDVLDNLLTAVKKQDDALKKQAEEISIIKDMLQQLVAAQENNES